MAALDLVAAASGTAVAEALTLPFCTLKTRVQTSAALEAEHAARGLPGLVRELYRREGAGAFLRASSHAVGGQVVSTSSKFVLYHEAQRRWNPGHALSGNVGSGLAAGVASTLLTHPLDVARIARQAGDAHPGWRQSYRGYTKTLAKISVGSLLFFPLFTAAHDATGSKVAASLFSAVVSTTVTHVLDCAKVRHAVVRVALGAAVLGGPGLEPAAGGAALHRHHDGGGDGAGAVEVTHSRIAPAAPPPPPPPSADASDANGTNRMRMTPVSLTHATARRPSRHCSPASHAAASSAVPRVTSCSAGSPVTTAVAASSRHASHAQPEQHTSAASGSRDGFSAAATAARSSEGSAASARCRVGIKSAARTVSSARRDASSSPTRSSRTQNHRCSDSDASLMSALNARAWTGHRGRSAPSSDCRCVASAPQSAHDARAPGLMAGRLDSGAYPWLSAKPVAHCARHRANRRRAVPAMDL